MGDSRIIVKRGAEVTRDGKAREGERGNTCDELAVGLAYPTDGSGQRMRNQVEPTVLVFIPQPPSPRSITLPAGRRGILIRMPSRSISTLALPRSTLLALSQAGYETTDELASSTPENLARGKAAFPDHRRGGS